MSKIAFVDLDGVIANNDARFAQATKDGKINWKMALNGDHVHMDTLIPGVEARLEALEKQGYTVIYLTSRPEPMREATEAWLKLHNIHNDRRMEMKPLSAQFVKTITWKAERLKEIADEAEAERIIFIDDEPANIEAARQLVPHLTCYSSLETACS